VFYRLDSSIPWQKATITQGEHSTDVRWSAELGDLEDGTYTLEAIALDQTSAAAAISDGGTAVIGTTIGGALDALIRVGAETHDTSTDIELLPGPSRATMLLSASVMCGEPDCVGPTGEVVFELQVATTWEYFGSAQLTGGGCALSIPRSTRGTFRARYAGDGVHLPSQSEELIVKSGSSGRAAGISPRVLIER
jgi:hypothetical protein